MSRIIRSLVLIALMLSACTSPTPAPAPTIVAPTSAPVATTAPAATAVPTAAPAGEEPLYVSIVWHQHQPLYYKNPQTGIYTRPWVRVHATKDYYDMASTVANYPNVHVTFNLTPVLIRQLDDFIAGAKDIYWVMAEKPADQLTDDDKRFILQRFFDSNSKIVARFPRYKELADKRQGADTAQIDAALQSFTTQDFRDLQVLFNLAWFDPDFLAQEPLKALVDKGRDFTEADKLPVFAKALDVIKGIVPLHKDLQDQGQIEVITTPYAHPILPLLFDTNLELTGNTAAIMPSDRFSYPNDAIAQLKKSVEIYQQHYGRVPRGLWPGEGSVAQEIVKMVGDAGYQWMATGEQVLAKSIGLASFTRDSADTVQQADQLYQPYVVENQQYGVKVNMVFRDLRISDLIGFEYSGKDGKAAAADLMQRLDNIRQELKKENATGPHLVSIILDGENAWENYPNDGKDFLNALYQNLSDSQTLKAVTPSEYFALHPPTQKIESLFPGAWFSSNYDTWIGEEEEATAWQYLLKTREALAEYDIAKRKTVAPDRLAQAIDFMYLAEGSDWFWWYGADQDSGDDAYFDRGFRALLEGVYTSLGLPLPDFVKVPIVSQRVATPSQQPQGLISPTIDGAAAPDEWARAGAYAITGGAQARSEDVGAALYYGVDAKTLSVRVDVKSDWTSLGDASVGVYFAQPRVPAKTAFTLFSIGQPDKTVLSFQATHLLQIDLKNGAVVSSTLFTSDGYNAWDKAAAQPKISAAARGAVLEAALPLDAFPDFEVGDDFRLAAEISQNQRDLQSIPASGPAQLVMPDLGTSAVVLSLDDPQGDDHGPGTYTYPTDGVFQPGVFDFKHFEVGYDAKNLIFKLSFFGKIPNPWGSPNNLAVQTIDVYIDKDPGAGTGARLLMPGRNAALPTGDGWDFGMWAEGWTPGVFAPNAQGEVQRVDNVDYKIMVDPAAQLVTLRIPLSVFGDGFDPMKAGYAAVVMSQDGFPAAGVWRIRDVEAANSQWRVGGAPADVNHTRIIDVIQPTGATPTQEELLSTYPHSTGDLGALTPDDFGLVPLLGAK